MEKRITYYDILGIDKSSDSNTIQLAYYKKIRKFPPEKHPEEAKKINNAYDTLSNAFKRKEYDKSLESEEIQDKYGKEIKEWLEKGMDFYEKENWDKALDFFKKILVVDADNVSVRSLSSLCYANLNNFNKAIEQMEFLITENPKIAEYYEAIGYLYLRYSRSSSNKKHLDKAESYFNKTIKIDERQSGSFNGLSEVELDRGNLESALNFLDKAINADNKIDITDLDFFLSKFQIAALLGKANKVKKDFNRMKIVIENEDIANYISYRLLNIAQSAYDGKFYYVCEMFLDIAFVLRRKIDKDLMDFYKNVRQLRLIFEQLNKLKNDSDVNESIKAYIYLLLDDSLSKNKKKEYLDNFISILDDMINYGEGFIITDSIKILKSKYSYLFDLNPKFFSDVFKAIDKYGSLPPSKYSRKKIIDLSDKWECGHNKYLWEKECEICHKKKIKKKPVRSSEDYLCPICRQKISTGDIANGLISKCQSCGALMHTECIETIDYKCPTDGCSSRDFKKVSI